MNKKTLIILVLAVIVVGVSSRLWDIPKKGGVDTEVEAGFNRPVVLKIGDSAVFPNELRVTLKQVGDSRCPADAVCVWQGELAPLFSAVSGSFEATATEIVLGTQTAGTADSHGYRFTLDGATETSATISISKIPAGSGPSGINGYVHMGPTCPVEKIPPDPQCADRPYAKASVTAISATGKQFSGQTDVGGSFHIVAPAGSYTVTITSGNIYPRCQEASATVAAGSFANVDISCDTGIR